MSVLVVGGGAAGLAAADFASREGAQVRILEKTRETGKKILLSGGTRCNVLPLEVDPERDYFTDSHRGAVHAVFRTWTLEECLQWMTSPRALNLALELEAETQKYFLLSNAARDVRDALLQSCLARGVSLEVNSDVVEVRRDGAAWGCITRDQRVFRAERVVLASGGRSYPKVGTDGNMYTVLKKLGHTLVAPYPALTPLIAPHPAQAQLSGVSLRSADVRAEDSKTGASCRSLRSGLLFTHRGLSGPSILDVSHIVSRVERPGDARVIINWTSESREEWEKRLKDVSWKGTVPNGIQRCGIPSRLAAALCSAAAIPSDRTLSHLTKSERRRLLDLLTAFEVDCSGHGGFRLAEVTGGGIPFEEIQPTSMESRLAPGLFICGELMDIFGRIGGFNFYWAWVSGRLAGLRSAL